MKKSCLDSHQKQQQKQSEKKILDYLKNKEPVYQTQISIGLKMDNRVLRKTLDRLLENKKIEIYHSIGLSKRRIYYVRKNTRQELQKTNLGKGKLTLEKYIELKSEIEGWEESKKLSLLSKWEKIRSNQENEDAFDALVLRSIKCDKNPKAKPSMEKLEVMVLASESVLSKRAVCKKAGISVTQFDRLIEHYPHLSNLRNRIQKLSPIDFDP